MKKLVVVLVVGLALAAASPALAWTWPVDGEVVRAYVFGDDPYAAGQHRGIDIAAPTGSDVRAPASGAVTFAGVVPSGGRTLTIVTGDGYAVTLQQLDSIGVAKGESVSEGQTVARSGPSTDASTSRPHVHLGVRMSDDRHGYVDPLSLLADRPGRLPPTTDPPPGEDASSALEPAVEPESGLELEPAALQQERTVEPPLPADAEPVRGPRDFATVATRPQPTVRTSAPTQLETASEPVVDRLDRATEETRSSAPAEVATSTLGPLVRQAVSPALDSPGAPDASGAREAPDAEHAPIGIALDVPVEATMAVEAELSAPVASSRAAEPRPPAAAPAGASEPVSAIEQAPRARSGEAGAGGAAGVSALPPARATAPAESAAAGRVARPRTSRPEARPPAGEPRALAPRAEPASDGLPTGDAAAPGLSPGTTPVPDPARAVDTAAFTRGPEPPVGVSRAGLQVVRSRPVATPRTSSQPRAAAHAEGAIAASPGPSPAGQASSGTERSTSADRFSRPGAEPRSAATNARSTGEAGAALGGALSLATLGLALIALGAGALAVLVCRARLCLSRSPRRRAQGGPVDPLGEVPLEPLTLARRDAPRCERRGRSHARHVSDATRVRRATTRRTSPRKAGPGSRHALLG